MPFEKGRSKQGGRKAGTLNKATTSIKDRIASLIDDQFDTIKDDLKQLEAKDRVTAYLKFLEYILPKQREQKIDLSSLSDEEIDELLNRALNKLEKDENNR